MGNRRYDQASSRAMASMRDRRPASLETLRTLLDGQPDRAKREDMAAALARAGLVPSGVDMRELWEAAGRPVGEART
jgi:hypothetical protein